MYDTSLILIIACAGVGALCIAAMIREVLLNKERDKWKDLFERRNRREWYDKI